MSCRWRDALLLDDVSRRLGNGLNGNEFARSKSGEDTIRSFVCLPRPKPSEAHVRTGKRSI